MAIAAMRRSRRVCQRGIAIAEWALAAVLGALVLAAALAWVQSSLVLAMSQRVPAQLQEASYWLMQRLERMVSTAGAGGVHPLGLDDPALSAWWPTTQADTGRVPSDQLLLQRRVLDERDDFDCEGRRTAVGARQISRLFLRRESVSPLWALACDAGYCDSSGCHALGDAGIVLMSGVSAIHWSVLAQGSANSPLVASEWDSVDALTGAMTPVGLRAAIWATSDTEFSRDRRWAAPPTWQGPAIEPLRERRAQHTLTMTWMLNHVP